MGPADDFGIRGLFGKSGHTRMRRVEECWLTPSSPTDVEGNENSPGNDTGQDKEKGSLKPQKSLQDFFDVMPLDLVYEASIPFETGSEPRQTHANTRFLVTCILRIF